MTSLQFVNENEVREAISDVRKDTTDIDWCLFSYEDAKAQRIVLTGKGSGGVAELATHLRDDMVGYGLVRKTDQIDDSKTVKFAFINWLGEDVPRMQKARISVHHGAVRQFIGQFHVDISASSKDEITDEILTEKVTLTSGSGSRVLTKQGTKEGTGSATRSSSSAAPVAKGTGALTFVNEADIKADIQDVRSDASDTNWVLVGYEGDSNNIVLLGKGNGGAEELLELLNDKVAAYGLVRKIEKIDESETVKFAYIRFVGDDIPRMLRARLGTHTGAVSSFFSPYHVSIDATLKSEISDDIIMKAIKFASGTSVHVVNNNNSGSAPATNSVRPTSSSYVAPRATSTTTVKPPAVPKVLNSDQGLRYDDEESIRGAIKEVRNDTIDTDWCLVGYEGGKGSTLTTLGKGNGGLEELLTHLNDKIVAYGLLRTTDKIDESLTVKFVFINWVGENIDRMHRARLGTHKGGISSLFAPYHVDVDCTNFSEVTPAIVKQRVQDASGSGSKVKN